MQYVPSDQVNLQHVQHDQLELGSQDVEVPNVQHLTWPMSQPTKQQQRIHVSINKDFRNFSQQPVISVPTLSSNQYQQGSTLVDTQQLRIANVRHQAVTPRDSIGDESLYMCNFIAQLQGNYEIENSTQISVILPQAADQEDHYAIVQRVDSDGKALADQRIDEELFWFTLKSVNGNLMGVLRKGSNMRQSVIWQNSNDGSNTVWRRKGEVTFNLVQVEPKVRRDSLSSVRTFSTSPSVAHPVDTPVPSYEDITMLNRSELTGQRGPVLLSSVSGGRYSPSESLSASNLFFGSPIAKSDQQQEEMFQVIKAQCSQNPLLFEKIVEWSVKNNPGLLDSDKKMKSIADGRLWVIVNTWDTDDGRAIVEGLDDIKGAYQKDTSGVYKQPDPEACGSGVQHRLLYDQNGRWKIEGQRVGQEGWEVRAQQLEDGRWVDLINNKMIIRVHLVPMTSILKRLDEQGLGSKKNLNKRIDFLFNSCNQAKLCRLKKRNLKHHIANLKVKLEKRYSLSLGVLVANVAQCIGQESEPSGPDFENWF